VAALVGIIRDMPPSELGDDQDEDGSLRRFAVASQREHQTDREPGQDDRPHCAKTVNAHGSLVEDAAFKWAIEDSNLWPPACRAGALAN
jgi:hypothetical protein